MSQQVFSRRSFIKTSTMGAGLVGTGGYILGNYTDADFKLSNIGMCSLLAHQVPVIANVDLLVVGGTTGAVTLAAEAARKGLTVFLAAPLPYLGEDVCGTLRLWPLPENALKETPAFYRSIFTDDVAPVRPLHVKTVLENELIGSHVKFLYSTYFVDALYDKSGQLSGGLIVNRSGCQAVCAKIVADASIDATVA